MTNDYIGYIRKQDAVNVVANTEKIVASFNYQYAIDALLALTPADVVPVVRCKDCKHYYFADNRIPQEQRYVCEISGEIWKPDSFCSYGERKE